MSIVELDSIIKDKFNYTVGAVYYFKVPGMVDLQYVSNDEYLMKCLDNCLLISRLVKVFCSHPINVKRRKDDPDLRQVPDVPVSRDWDKLEWEVNANEDSGEEEEAGEE